jgi:hypothetical protein
MKAYIVVTGAVFFLLAVSHVARFVAEGSRLLTEPIFISTTILSLGLFIWAAALFRRAGRFGL